MATSSDHHREQGENAVCETHEAGEQYDAVYSPKHEEGATGEVAEVGFDVSNVKSEPPTTDESGFDECFDTFIAEQAKLEAGLDEAPQAFEAVTVKKSISEVENAMMAAEEVEAALDVHAKAEQEVPPAELDPVSEQVANSEPSNAPEVSLTELTTVPQPEHHPHDHQSNFEAPNNHPTTDEPTHDYPDHIEDLKNFDPMAPPPMYYPPMGYGPMDPNHAGFYNMPPPMYPPMMPNGAPYNPYFNAFTYPLERGYSNVSVGSAPTNEPTENCGFYPRGNAGGFEMPSTSMMKDEMIGEGQDPEDRSMRPEDQPPYDGPMMPMMYNDVPPMGMYDNPQQPPPMNMYDGPHPPPMDMDYMAAPPPYYYPPMDQTGQHMGDYQNYEYMHPPPMTMTLQEQQATWAQHQYTEPAPEDAAPPRKNGKKGRVAKAPKPRKTTTRKRGGKRKQNRDNDVPEEAVPPLVELPTGFEQVLQRATGPSDGDNDADAEIENKPEKAELDNPEVKYDEGSAPPDSDIRESSYDPPRRRDYRRCETKVMLQTVDGHLFNKYFEEEDIRDFARRFKTLRCEFGFSQADVGAALGRRYGSDFSQTTISRFEGLVLSHSNMCKLRPPIEQWIADVQTALDSGIPIEQLRRACKGGDFWPSETPPPLINASLVPPLRKRRKRTSLEAAQRLALESYFEVNLRPDNTQMSEISRTLDLGFDVVRVWFCNRRQKARKDDAKIKARAARANGTMLMDMPTPSPTPSPSPSMEDVNEDASNEQFEEEHEMVAEDEPMPMEEEASLS
uniref:POU domain protein n=1 Tax=Panagrellus redivivus TaxID=6233 RepID=A0A7E4VDT6_PANRE